MSLTLKESIGFKCYQFLCNFKNNFFIFKLLRHRKINAINKKHDLFDIKKRAYEQGYLDGIDKRKKLLSTAKQK